MQTSRIGQMNCFVETVIFFPYAERESRETWLTWLIWGKILWMKPHPGVTNNSLEKQLVCVRIFCKIKLYWLCGLQTLRSKLTLTLIFGEDLKQGKHSPTTWKGRESALLPLLLKTSGCHALERDSLSEFSTESIILSFYYYTKSPLQGVFKQVLCQDW